MIKDFDKQNIGPCKYTFRLGEIFKHDKIDIVDIGADKVPSLKALPLPYILKPGEFVLGRTIEQFDTPLDLMSIYGASSITIRIGLHIVVGGINDPGYKGNAVMGIHNISENKVRLFRGMQLLHTAFLELKGRAIPIQTKYMGGKVL
ncbi:hypothetical protein HY642_04060 [Candidatus Woesearchaeota archaeon]|nr:hypothetical protein [Candidatus Woesearchaeota archaeon]